MLLKRQGKLLYKDWIYEWLNEQKNYVKESTYANYTNIVFNHIIPKLGNYKLSELSNQILQNFILNCYQNGRLDKTGGLSLKTVKDIVTVLKCSLKKAINYNKMEQINLNFIYPKENTKKINILTKKEQKKITNYIVNNINNKNIGILISMCSGIRIGELCALKWDDIDLKRNLIYINKTLQRIYIKEKNKNISKIIISSPKTKNAIREIPISKDLAKYLLSIRGKNNEYVITGNNKYIEPRAYRKYFSSFLKKLNLEEVNFHVLRHTFATNCINLGVNSKTVSELLGHSSVNITLNLYVHPELSEKKKCINLVSKNFIEI